MKFNGPEVIIGRPYKTRACNLEEYGAYLKRYIKTLLGL